MRGSTLVLTALLTISCAGEDMAQPSSEGRTASESVRSVSDYDASVLFDQHDVVSSLPFTTLWHPEDYPIPVVLSRKPSFGPNCTLIGSSFSASDSAAIWRVLNRIEERLNMDLFRPVERSELPTPVKRTHCGHEEGLPGGAISVARPTLGFRIPGRAGYPLGNASTTTECALSGVSMAGCPVRRIRSAAVRLYLADLDDGWTVAHEVWHALGATHTCDAPSLMTPAREGCVEEELPPSAMLTEYDIRVFRARLGLAREVFPR